MWGVNWAKDLIGFSRYFSTVNEMPYYSDYDNSGDDDDDDFGNKQNKYQQYRDSPAQTEREPSQMLKTIRERRAANIFNENYVADAQNNGK